MSAHSWPLPNDFYLPHFLPFRKEAKSRTQCHCGQPEQVSWFGMDFEPPCCNVA